MPDGINMPAVAADDRLSPLGALNCVSAVTFGFNGAAVTVAGALNMLDTPVISVGGGIYDIYCKAFDKDGSTVPVFVGIGVGLGGSVLAATFSSVTAIAGPPAATSIRIICYASLGVPAVLGAADQVSVIVIGRREHPGHNDGGWGTILGCFNKMPMQFGRASAW